MNNAIIFVGRKGQTLRSLTAQAQHYGLSSIPFAVMKRKQWFLMFNLS